MKPNENIETQNKTFYFEHFTKSEPSDLWIDGYSAKTIELAFRLARDNHADKTDLVLTFLGLEN